MSRVRFVTEGEGGDAPEESPKPRKGRAEPAPKGHPILIMLGLALLFAVGVMVGHVIGDAQNISEVNDLKNQYSTLFAQTCLSPLPDVD